MKSALLFIITVTMKLSIAFGTVYRCKGTIGYYRGVTGVVQQKRSKKCPEYSGYIYIVQ
jgi:hypothetical protein